MNDLVRIIAAVAATATAYFSSAFGQTSEQPVVLIIELDNLVTYRGDVTDAGRLARDPGVTAPGPPRAFQYTHNIADVVAVNGKPAKGLWDYSGSGLAARANAQPGQAIADFDTGGALKGLLLLSGPDGTWIGSLYDIGANPPQPSNAIVGGHGAFFGVIGDHRALETITPARVASVTEDPANRRINGGGKSRTIIRLYPRYRPVVDVMPTGPAVFHANFAPVSSTNPATAGEVLIVTARNLGPTRPDLLPPGSRAFKSDPLEVVNSPVEVTVNGREAEVINKVGWPGTSDLYRLDFRVPAGLPPGMATIQLTAAWIPGPEVKIPVQ
jgi:hypothetical protein